MKWWSTFLPIGTEEAENLALYDFEAYPFDGCKLPKALLQILDLNCFLSYGFLLIRFLHAMLFSAACSPGQSLIGLRSFLWLMNQNCIYCHQYITTFVTLITLSDVTNTLRLLYVNPHCQRDSFDPSQVDRV